MEYAGSVYVWGADGNSAGKFETRAFAQVHLNFPVSPVAVLLWLSRALLVLFRYTSNATSVGRIVL
jgi:hypothetical protein